MKLIPLSKNSKKNKGKYFAIIDDDDFEQINKYNWSLQRGVSTNYAITCFYTKSKNGKRKQTKIYLHRMIMPPSVASNVVDHKNHNGLDCRKSNIRESSYSQNGANRKSAKGASSKYLGVRIFKCRKGKAIYKYIRAGVSIRGRKKYLGTFKTEKQAAKAYNKAAKKLYGEFANLNKID